MCNRYRRPSIVASFQVSVHFAKQFERRRFYKIGQSETRIAMTVVAHLAKGKVNFYHHLARVVRRLSFVVCRPLTIHRPSIVASYQVSVHFAKQFERRRFYKIGQSEKRIACGDHFC
jgi:hypothetical protein